MFIEKPLTRTILVVEDVHETREGIQKLLQADGYRVTLAQDERGAVDSVSQKLPDLILVSLAGTPGEVVLAAKRIRESAAIDSQIPVVIFCIETLAEGEEVAIGRRVYLTRPDNFNQLRNLLARLLNRDSSSIETETTMSATELNL
jgi:CheY-like chemotaxis protein